VEGTEICIIWSFVICNPHLIFLKDQIKDDEMGGVCGTYQRNKKCKQGFGSKHWTNFHKKSIFKMCGI
jgi:hypothetical protein